eukprot:4746748-Amphidinium_carterae.1
MEFQHKLKEKTIARDKTPKFWETFTLLVRTLSGVPWVATEMITIAIPRGEDASVIVVLSEFTLKNWQLYYGT